MFLTNYLDWCVIFLLDSKSETVSMTTYCDCIRVKTATLFSITSPAVRILRKQTDFLNISPQ